MTAFIVYNRLHFDKAKEQEPGKMGIQNKKTAKNPHKLCGFSIFLWFFSDIHGIMFLEPPVSWQGFMKKD